MIRIENYNKTFRLKSGDVEALKDVSLTIQAGEKYGVIGYSGAGKSTLVRCINFLETPDCGSIDINGTVITIKDGVLYKEGHKMSEKELNNLRKSIGMIFQHFNLLDRSTVFENIAYPLRHSGLKKEEIAEKVFQMLDLVGLREKVDVYPSQLSGGQKQRVAIARALVNNPKILLSDEATSALDPEATESILNLLNELNRKLGLTIIIITHEMAVIKTICDKVAVMEGGRVVEEGGVYDIFANPQAPITKKFVNSTSSLGKVEGLLKAGHQVVSVEEGVSLYKLIFEKSVDRPVISEISREFNVNCNIVLANVEVIGEDALGAMIVKIEGDRKNVEDALAYLEKHNVRLEVVA
ncbi:MAG: ATP-binding cassette domain-containing protein [Spirochaetales bacterium]|nr:ATP-binding cassette domain-containing protein [Candidatus Physcosoma equi]